MQSEIDQIVEAFLEEKAIDDFSVVIEYSQAKEKYSLAAGQYFDVKIEYIELTQEEFEEKINGYKETLTKLFQEGDALNKEIQASLEKLKYEKD